MRVLRVMLSHSRDDMSCLMVPILEYKFENPVLFQSSPKKKKESSAFSLFACVINCVNASPFTGPART